MALPDRLSEACALTSTSATSTSATDADSAISWMREKPTERETRTLGTVHGMAAACCSLSASTRIAVIRTPRSQRRISRRTCRSISASSSTGSVACAWACAWACACVPPSDACPPSGP